MRRASRSIPKTVDEMIAQGQQMQGEDRQAVYHHRDLRPGDFANSARGYYSWLYDQNGSIFPNGYREGRLQDAGIARRVRRVSRSWSRRTLITKGLDGGGAIGAFLNGNGAVYLTGTWRIDDFLAAEAKPDRRCPRATPRGSFPSLFKTQSVWTDNHSWVLPKGGTTTGNPQGGAGVPEIPVGPQLRLGSRRRPPAGPPVADGGIRQAAAAPVRRGYPQLRPARCRTRCAASSASRT